MASANAIKFNGQVVAGDEGVYVGPGRQTTGGQRASVCQHEHLDTKEGHMTQHTPGPWHMEHISGAPFYPDSWHIVGEKELVGEVFNGVEANARLIAKAPEMYKVLEQLADEMQAASSAGDPVPVEWLDRRIKRLRALLRGGD